MASSKKKSAVAEILSERGLAIKEFRRHDCGFGIIYMHPVIIDKKSKKQTIMNAETFGQDTGLIARINLIDKQ